MLYRNQNILIFILILLLGLYLRLNNITFHSFWYDELFSVDFSHPSNTFQETLKLTIEDVHPPFYQTILWIWLKIFGLNEFNARLLSVIIGIMTVIASYYLSKEFYNQKYSLVVAFLLSSNIFLVWYSQEARSYQLTVLLSILSYLYLYRAILTENKKNLFLYWLVTIIWMYTHYFSFFIIASQFVFTFIYMIFFTNNKKQLIKTIILTALIFFISLLPLLPYILEISNSEKFSFLLEPSPLYFLTFIHFYFGYGGVFFVLIAFLLNLYFILTTKINNKEKVFLLMLFSWVFFGYFILYLKSIFSFSLIQLRYTIVMIPPIILLSVFGVSKLKKYLQMIILFIVIIFSFKVLFFDYHDTYKQDHRNVLKYVSKYNSIPIYELIPGNGHNGNNTNHYQVYADMLNLDLKIIDDTKFKKEILKDSLPSCFWVLYSFNSVDLDSQKDVFDFYKINANKSLIAIHKEEYFKAEASLISKNNNTECKTLSILLNKDIPK